PRRLIRRERAFVRLRTLAGVTQIPPLPMGVVDPLVGHWPTAQRREVPAVGPAANADPGQVEVGVPSGGLMQRDDLVLQRQVAAVAVHRALPTRPAARGRETRNTDCGASTSCPPRPAVGPLSTGRR